MPGFSRSLAFVVSASALLRAGSLTGCSASAPDQSEDPDSSPTFHKDDLRAAKVGHFFEVITKGLGVMPSYAAQIPPADRWAIVAYVRALQLSQHSAVAALARAAVRAARRTPGRR